MSNRKKIYDDPEVAALAQQIRQVAGDLSYTSETDAKIKLFIGDQATAVTGEIILAQTGSKAESAVQEKDFGDFFNNLTALQDWFGDDEKLTAQKFSDLRDLLQNNLKNLKVFKIGSTELDIYAVGLNSENILMGIKTKAVET